VRTNKDQCTRDRRSIDFNEDLHLWRELKLTRSPGRLFRSVTTRSEKKKLIEMTITELLIQLVRMITRVLLTKLKQIIDVNANKTIKV